MKLYLSSYHLGDKANQLSSLFSNKKVALISNALDFSTDIDRRKKSTETELKDLKSVGLNPEEIDLRTYFGNENKLRSKISEFGGVWLRGGNSFVLLRAIKYSGFDNIIRSFIKNDSFVYAGYSAGICVATPSLKGIELVDDPHIIPDGYKDKKIWEGMSLVNYSIAPHYNSNHPESKLINKSVEYFIREKMLFKALKDGDVIIDAI